MKLLSIVVLVVLMELTLRNYVTEASKKSTVRHYRQKYHYKYKYKYKNKHYKWPKVRGRCKVAPKIEFNGTNPIIEASAKGNTVVVLLMKRNCKYCLAQLEALNDMAEHYRESERKVAVIAFNHKRQPLPAKVIKAYPYVDIYEEPNSMDIFGQLKGNYRQVLIYDICGRQQYHYGYPYSWLGYPLVRYAILNTISHHEQLCGKCKQNVPKTTATTSTTTTAPKKTTNKITPIKVEEEAPPETLINNINGPFTQT